MRLGSEASACSAAAPSPGDRLEELEQDLHEGVARQIALGVQLLDELLERQVLMRVGVERGRADAVDELEERGLATEVDAQHERVDEEADEALGLHPVPVGDRGAHDHVVLSRPARQHHVEGGEHDHEERRPALASEPRESLDEVRRHGEGVVGAAMFLNRRARPVGRQVEHGQVGESLAPVVELAREDVARQPTTLPGREVAVLDLELGQVGLAPAGERQVGGLELAGQHAERPAVGHDVVGTDHEQVVTRPEPGDQHAEEGTAGEVERRILEVRRDPRQLALTLGGRQLPQVAGLDRYLDVLEHDLHRLLVLDREDRPQHLVASDDHLERALEDPQIEVEVQPCRERDVVERTARQ